MDNISAYTYLYSDVGNRKENEDSAELRIYGKNLIAVVADGLGGQGDGKTASELVCQALMRCGSQNEPVSREEISEAFEKANDELIRHQENTFHMKTTAVYLCIHEDQAVWAHVGDSRLYHFYEEKLCDYTLDHSISQLAVAMGEIRREDIPRHPGRSRLYRAIGAEGENAEIHDPVVMEKGRHAFLLCSDGFWEYLPDHEIEEDLRKSETAEDWIGFLRERIKRQNRIDQDNNTAVAIIVEV